MAEGKKDQGTLTDDGMSSSGQTLPTDPPDVGGGDLRGAAQQSQAERDAEEEKARTTYVLLLLHEEVVLLEGSPLTAWEELGRIRAASRAAAWEEAKRRYPQVKPTAVGAQTSCQLVPERFFQTVTARAKPPREPELEVEGL